MRLFKWMVALAATVAMLFGVPAVLVSAWTPSPIADPGGLREIGRALTDGGAVSDRAIVSVLVVLCWVLWAWVAAAFAYEFYLAASNRAAAFERPSLNVAQALVRPLVGALMWSTTASTLALSVAGAGTVSVLTAPPAVAQVLPEPGEYRSLGMRPSESPPAATVAHVVAEDSTLWRLAADVLGDPMRWVEIVELNDLEPEMLEVTAGTELRLPADALLDALTASTDAVVAASGSEEGETATVTVQPGESMWSITEDRLEADLGRAPSTAETAAMWDEVVERNTPHISSGDPDLIYPGEQIIVWTPAADASEPDVLPAMAAERSDPTGEQVAGTPSQTDGLGSEMPPAGRFLDDMTVNGAAPVGLGIETPETVIGTSPGSLEAVLDDGVGEDEAQTRELEPSQVAAAPVSPPVVVPQGDLVQPDEVEALDPAELDRPGAPPSATASLRWGVILAGMSILAGGLWLMLRTRRRRILGNRPPGTVPASDAPEVAALERAAASASHGERADRSTAILSLAQGLIPLIPPSAPAVLAVLADDEALELVWDGLAPEPLVEGIAAVMADRWTMSLSSAGLLEPFVCSAMPALVTLGDGDVGEVLLNLESVRRIDMGGARDDVERFAVRAALELALSPVSECARVICVGFGAEIASIPKVEYAEDLDDVIAAIESHASWADEATRGVSLVDTRAENPGAELDPVVVFDLTGTASDRLVEATELAGGVVVAVCWADTDAEWAISIDATEVRVGGTLNTTVISRPLEPDMVDLVVSIVDDDPAYEESAALLEGEISADIDDMERLLGADDFVPPEPMAIDAGVVVKVLGPPSATGVYLTGRQLELVALMLANGNKITANRICDEMYGGDPYKTSSVKKLLGRTRSTLGKARDGTDRLSFANPIGEYQLTDVASDLNEVLNVVRRVKTDTELDVAAKADLIDAAVQLIEGEPYAGPVIFEWALPDEAAIAVVAVDDLCRELAAIYIALGNHTRARWAIRQGLKACVQCVALYEMLLDTVLEVGSQSEVAAVWSEVQSAFDDEVPEALLVKYGQEVRQREVAV